MTRSLLALGAALLGASTVLAQTCSLSQKCPKEAPCCSRTSPSQIRLLALPV